MPSQKHKIALIGAGKISFSLANALISSGFNVTAIISRNLSSAKKLAAKFKIKIYSDCIEDIPKETNTFFLSVPDNQIAAVSSEISRLKLNFNKSCFIHLSGVETIGALNSISKAGGKTGSLHIMQTFPIRRVVNLNNCYAAVETKDKKTETFLFALCRKLNLVPFSINSGSKVLYHLAGVYASNFLVGNFFHAEKLFSKVSKKKIISVINPIIKTTLENIQKKGAANSLSGPLERGDKNTIIKHLAEFDKLAKTSGDEFKYLKKNYIIQSLGLLELIKERDKKSRDEHSEIKNILIKAL